MRFMKLFAMVGLPVVTVIGAGTVVSAAAKAPTSQAAVRTVSVQQAPMQVTGLPLAAVAAAATPATGPQAEPAGTETETPAASETAGATDPVADGAGGHNDTGANADHQFDGTE